MCPLRKEKVREDVEGCRSGLFYVKVYHCKGKGKGKVCIQAKWPIQPELIIKEAFQQPSRYYVTIRLKDHQTGLFLVIKFS